MSCEKSKSKEKKIAEIESLYQKDVGRGITPLTEATQGQLWQAARSFTGHSLPHVVIITGFFIPLSNPPAPENDGPLGAIHLAITLHRLSIPVRLLCDFRCAQVIEAALEEARIPFIPLDIVPENSPSSFLEELLSCWSTKFPPVSHLVAIEKAGQNREGVVCNMRGEDISLCNPPFDELFRKFSGLRVGIGDGGNELGMGNFPLDLVASAIKNGERIACVTPCDHLLVCGVSNWGAWGLAAAISLLKEKIDLWEENLTGELDYRILSKITEAGLVVDGMAGLPQMSIDNISWPIHSEILGKIRKILSA